MLTVRVGGVWLHSIAAYAAVTFSHEWPHGSALASWAVPPGTTHPALTGGALVEVFDGGLRIWRGRLSEPSESGAFNAVGSWQVARNVSALDGAGNPTNVPDDAIDNAITRGAVAWTRPVSLSSVAWGTASESLKLADLLDQAMAGLGKRWYVDADGAVRASVDPTTPTYHVPHAVAGRGPTLAEDDYYSNLVGQYLAAGPVFATINAHLTAAGTTSTNQLDGDNPAKDRWGYRETVVDLTDMGVISGATATAELGGRLALVGARMGFAEGLELGFGQITTRGGTPVALTLPRAGEMVRLMGVTDQTRTASLPYTDIVIGSSSYKDGAGVVQLNPVGMAARNLTDVLKAAVA